MRPFVRRMMRALLLSALAALALGVACASAQWAGDYPLPPPGVPPHGHAVAGWRIPRAGANAYVRAGTAEGPYDCAALLNTYWTDWYRANGDRGGMLGIAIASLNGGPLQKFWARSGYEQRPTTAPTGGAQPAGNWEWVKSADRNAAQVASEEFTTSRRCFGTPAGDWQATGQHKCEHFEQEDQFNPNTIHHKIRRRWTNGADQEKGMPAGACALAKLVTQLKTWTIHCAAELSPSGWNTGKTLDPAGTSARYGPGEIVSSCVTCQNIVPMLLPGGHCPLRASETSVNDLSTAAITNGRTKGTDGQPINCPAKLLDGDSCLVTCNDGAEWDSTGPAVTSCAGGVLTKQSCVSKCKVLKQHEPVAHVGQHAEGACAVGFRIPLKGSCQFPCAQNYEPSGQLSCDSKGVITGKQECVSKCKLASTAPLHSDSTQQGNTCAVGMRLDPGKSCVWKGAQYYRDVEVKCDETGKLSEPRECPSTCKLLQVPENSDSKDCMDRKKPFELGQSLELGGSCTYQCKTGFQSSSGRGDAATASCTAKGVLTVDACVSKCPLVVAPTNADSKRQEGNIYSRDVCKTNQPMKPSERCFFGCARGYRPEPQEIICNRLGEVKSQPKCILKCQVGDAPTNFNPKVVGVHSDGIPVCTSGLLMQPNSRCSFACKSPYLLDPPILTCNEDGELSNKAATQQCVSPCEILAWPANTDNTYTGKDRCQPGQRVEPGASCTFRCAGSNVLDRLRTECSPTGVLTAQKCVPDKAQPGGFLQSKTAKAIAGTVVTGVVCFGLHCAAKQLGMTHSQPQPTQSGDSLSPPFAALSSRLRARAGQSQAALQPLSAEGA